MAANNNQQLPAAPGGLGLGQPLAEQIPAMNQNPVVAAGLLALYQTAGFPQLIDARAPKIPDFIIEPGMTEFQRLTKVLLHVFDPRRPTLYNRLRVKCPGQAITPQCILGLTTEEIADHTGIVASKATAVHHLAQLYQNQPFEGVPDDDQIYQMLQGVNLIGAQRAFSLMVFGLPGRVNFIPGNHRPFKTELTDFIMNGGIQLTHDQAQVFVDDGYSDQLIDQIVQGWHPHRGLALWLIWNLHT